MAAANGLAPGAHVISGTSLTIPGAAGPTTASAGPTPLGGYTVRPGDTLTALASRTGGSVGQIAWMNGISPAAPLVIGTALKLPTSSASANAPTAVTHATTSPPYAAPGHASAGEIGGIASANGVPAALAEAIAWQESGFSNGAVSSANARGVMQVEPGTWDWINQHLARTPLDPTSRADNIRAGSLYLGQLLRDTGGDQATAIASYYQGLGSVRSIGILPSTRSYVANVLALERRFGG